MKQKLASFWWGFVELAYILFILCFILEEFNLIDNVEQLRNPAFIVAGIAFSAIIVSVEFLTPEWPVLLWLSTSLLFPLAAQIFRVFFGFLGNPGLTGMLIISVLLNIFIVFLFNLFRLKTIKDKFWLHFSIGCLIGILLSCIITFAMSEIQNKYSSDACTYMGAIIPTCTLILSCKICSAL